MRALVTLVLATAASAAGFEVLSAEALWPEWKVQYNRTYSASEENLRFRHFSDNVAHINHLNHRHVRRSARFAVNKFADWSPSELKSLRGTRIPKNARDGMPVAPLLDTSDLRPVDWRARGPFVAPIQDQGQCGSCWAFSATSNMESVYAIKRNASIVKLAEQVLVDCDHTCGTYRQEQGCDQGCEGGLMPNAFVYTKTNGQTTEGLYPYTAADGTCNVNGLRSGVQITGFQLVSQDEDQMASYVATTGPVSVAVDASEWTFYFGGIMEYLCWGKDGYGDLDHGVNVVGFGANDEGTKFWIIRNSWGQDWGEDGYARILRGTGFCGVNLFACSATA